LHIRTADEDESILHIEETSTMADLEQLKEQITAAGEKVKTLKSSVPVNKDAIGAAVKELMDLKKQYADNNNGIGVDGKKFEEPMTKAQKKAKEKAEKEAGPAKTVRVVLTVPNVVLGVVPSSWRILLR
jgi:septum formation inhibitor MinC